MKAYPELNRDGSERVDYTGGAYPLYVQPGALSYFPEYRAITHWHDDVEFILLFDGAMDYNVNGQIVHLAAGEGIFVNTRQLHYGFSPTGQECHFLCVLFHPRLLAATAGLEQQFIAPVLQNPALPWLHLSPAQPPQQAILTALAALQACQAEPAGPLAAQALLFQIWHSLYTLAHGRPAAAPPRDRRLTALREMISHIETHYAEKLTLAEIARAGAVGKTRCCAIFDELTNQTPIAYLNSFRLRRSVELLRATDWSVAEICFAVGFGGASYYTESFRRAYGCTPTAYRDRVAPLQQELRNAEP